MNAKQSNTPRTPATTEQKPANPHLASSESLERLKRLKQLAEDLDLITKDLPKVSGNREEVSEKLASAKKFVKATARAFRRGYPLAQRGLLHGAVMELESIKDHIKGIIPEGSHIGRHVDIAHGKAVQLEHLSPFVDPLNELVIPAPTQRTTPFRAL